MKNKLLPLAFLLLPKLVFGETTDVEMRNYQKSINDSFRDFPDRPPAGGLRETRLSNPYNGKKNSNPFTTANFNKASQSPYAKSQAMKTIAQLALAWAQTAGSMQGLQSSQQAASMASALSASSDPQFQQMGGLLSQESSSVASADRPSAENAAGQIASIPPPYVAPGYQPTQGEDWLVSAFTMAAGGVVSTLTGVLGALAVKDILSSLGISGSPGTIGIGSSIGSGLGSAAVNGQNAAPILQGGAQSGIAQSGGSLSSAIQSSSGSMINTNPVSSSQSGSVPGSGH